MQDVLHRLLDGSPLPEAEARRAFSMILSGQANESQVGAMLALIAQRGPTLDELVGGARVMREHVTALPLAPDDPIRGSLIDTCGTGGAPKTFNISTAAAIVAAASAPQPGGPRAFVAKHGGRSRSGRGSAEVLATLGVNIDAAPAVQALCLREVGVCFSFAVNHHPAMRFAAGPRKSLGFPTIFNLLGPLCNPAGASRQVMGVYEARYVEIVAQALARLGATRAMVVHGGDGMDEITTTAPSTIAHVEPSGVRIEDFDPRPLGIALAKPEALVAASLDDAAAMVLGTLQGRPGAARDIVELNAAAALVVAGSHSTLASGLNAVRRAIDGGEAVRTLEALARASHRAS
jgi:anthranilate phosphoribosyltransferase